MIVKVGEVDDEWGRRIFLVFGIAVGERIGIERCIFFGGEWCWKLRCGKLREVWDGGKKGYE